MGEEIINKALFSKRSQKKLSEYQAQLNSEVQSLSSQYVVLTGAFMACDEITQRNMIADYRNQLYSVHDVLGRLCVMLDKLSREI